MQDMATLQRLLPPAAVAFAGVLHREIVMDINDVEGGWLGMWVVGMWVGMWV